MKTLTINKLPAKANIGILLVVILLLSSAVYGNIYTVTSTNNTGAGTLHQAITDANANPGLDTIRFNIGTSGNYFESSGANSWPVIRISSGGSNILPIITDPVLIDGFTQANSNTGTMAGKVVGADNYTQPGINYPDVYITPANGYSFSSSYNNTTSHGLVIGSTDVTIRGICISGFGNTNSNSSRASSSADITILRFNAAVNCNIDINNCFISCDPRGNYPSISARRSLGNAILIMGHMEYGNISNNYIAYPGTYGIHFNGGFDPQNVGPGSSNLENRGWTITENQIMFMGMNTSISTSTKAADAVNMMHCRRVAVTYNYIEDSEQVGIDMGYNADSNFIYNNSLTGFTNTSLAAPLACIRVGLASQGDSIIKNHIYNNTSSQFRAGIWIDQSSVSTSGVTVKDNINNYVAENVIHDNNASAIVMSDFVGLVNARYNTFSRNSTYDNAGLGIDLGFSGTGGSPAVTVNDNNDSDNGHNDLQNYPIIDSATINAFGFVTIWGKSTSGATLEFFGSDGGTNNQGGRSLNYGEGKYFIGSGVEGDVNDGASGSNTATVSFDGNSASIGTLRMFRFSFFYVGPAIDVNTLTATATLNGSTSEFGPTAPSMTVLGCNLLDISALYNDGKTKVMWSAICDEDFSYFVVERSTDGSNYSSIGEVYPYVDISREYSFDLMDFNPANGNNYYRLKILNKDGGAKYSKIVRINTGNTTRIKLSPNPFVSEINFSVSMKRNDIIAVRLTDVNGRTVLTRQFNGQRGVNAFSISNLDYLPKGYYIAELTYEGQSVTEKIIKN